MNDSPVVDEIGRIRAVIAGSGKLTAVMSTVII